jgi:hypothetical protein
VEPNAATVQKGVGILVVIIAPEAKHVALLHWQDWRCDLGIGLEDLAGIDVAKRVWGGAIRRHCIHARTRSGEIGAVAVAAPMCAAVGIAVHKLLVHGVADAGRAVSEALRAVVVVVLLRLLLMVVVVVVVVLHILRGAKVNTTIVVVDWVRCGCSRRITRTSWGVKVGVVERGMQGGVVVHGGKRPAVHHGRGGGRE